MSPLKLASSTAAKWLWSSRPLSLIDPISWARQPGYVRCNRQPHGHEEQHEHQNQAPIIFGLLRGAGGG